MVRAMKEKNLWSLWKNEVQCDGWSLKQKAVSAWFGTSFILLGISGGSILMSVLAGVNLVLAACAVVRNIPMEDE